MKSMSNEYNELENKLDVLNCIIIGIVLALATCVGWYFGKESVRKTAIVEKCGKYICNEETGKTEFIWATNKIFKRVDNED